MAIVNRILIFSIVLLVGTTVAAAETQADQILAASGVKGGFVVVVGCQDPELLCKLRANDSYMVHGLDTDQQMIDKARQYIKSKGLYGKISADKFDGQSLPYIDNMVNLIVVPGNAKVGGYEIRRALSPRGVAIMSPQTRESDLRLDKVKIAGSQWSRFTKAVPDSIDDWTHFLHSANGNAVSADTEVASPFHAQWVAGPKFTKTHSSVTAMNIMVSSKGRMFSIIDEGPIGLPGFLPSKWTLVARDAFNGIVLWKRPISSWQPYNNPQRRMVPADLHRRLVADTDRVYATLDIFGPTVALAAATGETLITYKGTELTQEIIHDGGTLFLVLGTTDPENVNRRQLADGPLSVEKKRIMAVNAETGKILWEKDDEETLGVLALSLTARDNKVFFQNENAIFALDAENGKQVWRHERKSNYLRFGWGGTTLVALEDVLLAADRAADAGPEVTGGQGEVRALSIATGEKLWSGTSAEGDSSPTDIFYADGKAWIGEEIRRKEPDYAHGRDILTGEALATFDLSENWPMMHHHRCYRDKATENFILAGRTGVEFIDLETGKLLPHHWIRGNCKHGILPCNGLLYVPPHQCACYTESKLNGLWALAPKRQKTDNRRQTTEDRLEKGPAFGKIANRKSQIANPDDWPTFRHDSKRSGYTKTSVGKSIKSIWQAKLAKGLTQPVMAGGKLFVASKEQHTVYALEAKTGKKLWTYTAGGPVDSPPSISAGMVVFGSTDGYVYALRAADGALAWRYRAAQQDRRIISYGSLESVWPVHGSVLIEDGKVYCASGRTSYLDGGMYFLKLDLATGEKLLEKNYFSRNPETGETVAIYEANPAEVYGEDRELPGLLPDILSSDDNNIYMRHAVMNRDFDIKDGYETHLFSSMGFLDDTWWERAFWVYGEHFYSGCYLWPFADILAPGGRMLTFDDNHVFGFKEAHTKVKARLTEAEPQSGETFCVDIAPKVMTEKEAVNSLPKDKRKNAYRSVRRYHYNWEGHLPLMPRAMVLTDDHLFSAGPEVFDEKKLADYFFANRTDDADLPDYVDDALDSYQGRKGSILAVTDKADGKVLYELELDSAPVFDGMIAADEKLFISMTDGTIVCLEGKK